MIVLVALFIGLVIWASLSMGTFVILYGVMDLDQHPNFAMFFALGYSVAWSILSVEVGRALFGL